MAEQDNIDALLGAARAAAIEETEQRLRPPFARDGEIAFATDVSQFDAAQAYEVAARDLLAQVRFHLERARDDAERAAAEHHATLRDNQRAAAAARADARTVRRAARRLTASQRGKVALEQARTDWDDRRERQDIFEKREADLSWRLRECIAWLEEQLASYERYKVDRIARRRENDLPSWTRWYRSEEFWAQDDRYPAFR